MPRFLIGNNHEILIKMDQDLEIHEAVRARARIVQVPAHALSKPRRNGNTPTVVKYLLLGVIPHPF